jgi:hypothetical protein
MKDLVSKVTKRVNISLSDGLYADLEVWSEQEKSSPTALAGSLVVESGKFESARLKALMEGGQPSEVELLRVALLIGVSEEYIKSLPLRLP